MVKLVVLANLLAIDFCFQFFFVVFIEKKKKVLISHTLFIFFKNKKPFQMDLNKLVMVILVRLGIFVYTKRLMKILVVCHFQKYSLLLSLLAQKAKC